MKKSRGYLLICLALMLFGGCSSEQTSGYVSKGADYAKQPTTTVIRTTAATDPLVGGRTSFKDMRVGDIGKKGDIYVSLNYVKRADILETELGPISVGEGNEVVVGFFELYNSSNSIKRVDPSQITCYADGVQVSDVESYIKVYIDGVKQFYSEEIDPGCQMLSCQDFEVPRGWKEIKFFYQSDCVWTVNSEDVTEKIYNKELSIIPQKVIKETGVGDVIYSGDYSIEYMGYEMYHHSTIVGDDDYVIFKFRVTNETDNILDFDHVGHNMRAYQNNVFLGGADFALNEKIGTFINLFDIKKIEPGMKGDIYIAFEAKNIPSDFYMIYDDGFLGESYRGSVYIKHE